MEVERIIKKRIKNRCAVEYLVKWKNHDESHNQWLPVNSMDCDSLIQQFEEAALTKQQKKKKTPMKRLKGQASSGGNNKKKSKTDASDPNSTEFNGIVIDGFTMAPTSHNEHSDESLFADEFTAYSSRGKQNI